MGLQTGTYRAGDEGSTEWAMSAQLYSGEPRIFLGGGANSQSGCANLVFAENCMKTKEFGSPGGRASLTPP